MIGTKICDWLTAKFPLLVRMAGNMNEQQAIAFAFAMLLLAYALYTAVYNGWLVLNRRMAELEPYEDWMDAEAWRVEE